MFSTESRSNDGDEVQAHVAEYQFLVSLLNSPKHNAGQIISLAEEVFGISKTVLLRRDSPDVRAARFRKALKQRRLRNRAEGA